MVRSSSPVRAKQVGAAHAVELKCALSVGHSGVQVAAPGGHDAQVRARVIRIGALMLAVRPGALCGHLERVFLGPVVVAEGRVTDGCTGKNPKRPTAALLVKRMTPGPNAISVGGSVFSRTITWPS
jgi:hypothetical protein